MTDSSGTPMFPARDSRLTPEAVAERGFTPVKRGYAESEVRAFLRMVADDLGSMRTRERELLARLQELEGRLQRPAQPPTDQDLINALGQETARVLGQAREAAVDLRAKADEHARRVVREAQESARELRASTQQAVEAKTREAEDAARARARDIVAEARALRDRVLSDLNERRTDLERQVGELRAGRGRLVEVYELVERALVQATRTMAEEPVQPVVPTPEVSEPAPDAAPDVDTPRPVARDAPPPQPEPPNAEPQSAESHGAESHSAESHSEGRDVGALFQKLRSESGATDEPGTAAVEPHDDAVEMTAETVVLVETVEVVKAVEVIEVIEAIPVEEDPDDPGDGDRAALKARDETLAPIADNLAHRAKRALQDEQNDILDGLRRQRGTIDVGKVLPTSQDQLSRWAHVLQPAVDAAYAAGAATVSSGAGGASATAPSALLTELTTAVVAPLRTRLESSITSIDARTPADVEIAIAQRLGARYREWRGQDLEQVLGDTLAAAFTRGVYDAAPKGARLRWVPARLGKCPDCDDNALEPTVRGEQFPTGQSYPPAHPGCRCLLVLATDSA
jgi:DivIVA domain-containing protein